MNELVLYISDVSKMTSEFIKSFTLRTFEKKNKKKQQQHTICRKCNYNNKNDKQIDFVIVVVVCFVLATPCIVGHYFVVRIHRDLPKRKKHLHGSRIFLTKLIEICTT